MRKAFVGRFSAAVRKIFQDIFSDRSDTAGSLGTATDGSQWEAVSKTIEVQDGKAVADYIPQPSDDGSEYPIAVVNMPTQNNIITLEDTDVGSGVALWVQTSADWWMVSVDSAYNFIPGGTNYTSAPATFTGQAAYSVSSQYTSAGGEFSSAFVYSLGAATYSSLPIEYSSGTTSYTTGPTNYTSALPSFSGGPVFSSSVPFSSSQNFSSSQAFFSAIPSFSGVAYSVATTNYFENVAWSASTTWNRWAPYTSAGGNTWFRAYVRVPGSNTYFRSYTRSAINYSVTNFYNATTVWTRAVTGQTWGQTWFAQPFTQTGPTNYSSAPRVYSSANPVYSTGAPNYTSQLFYTSAAGNFTSALVFSSTTPYSSATPYSSSTTFSSATSYFAGINYSASDAYSQGATYTSASVYSSATGEDTFAYSAILRISNSVSDVVSDISSLIVSTSQTIKSILVQTSENQITAKAFAEVIPVTQVGDDLIYTATGAIINTRYGISISKAEYQNDKIAGSVKIERSE
jgi:hypothetical protein